MASTGAGETRDSGDQGQVRVLKIGRETGDLNGQCPGPAGGKLEVEPGGTTGVEKSLWKSVADWTRALKPSRRQPQSGYLPHHRSPFPR